MSSPDRRLVILAPLALVACGFQPVYGPGGTGSALKGRILVSAPDNEDSYFLVRRLEERLGRAGSPAYTLSLSLSTREEGLAIDGEGNIDRFNVIGAAGYVLADAATGEEVTSGTVNGFTGYSATGTTIVTFASQRDAHERLMTILGDQITTRLLSFELPS